MGPTLTFLPHCVQAFTMILPVNSEEDYSVLRELLLEFHEWMAEHDNEYEPEKELTGDFESLERERESWAWIARNEGNPAGCVLLYGETDTLAEFRRLWVSPAHRGTGIGRILTQTVIEKAQSQGYETLGLTTPPWAAASHTLYESMGFEQTPPYPGTRLPEKFHDQAIFMQLSLGDSQNDTKNE